MIIIQQFFNIAKMAIVKAADWPRSRYKVQRILSINRVVGNLDLSESFYCEGLGFQPVKRRAVDKSLLAALGVGEGQETVLQLGNDLLTLVEFAHPGRPYPCPRLSNDPWFQHIAIIVADMDEAYARLSRRSDWTPVSQGGPQTLPPENGQVRAFQFRDPDGHPIEFLWFPPGYKPALCQGHAASSTYLGIDHSALSVRSTSMSLRFYAALGFSLVAQTLNQGPPQDHLDGLEQACVTVSSLQLPSAATPSLELLAYHPPRRVLKTINPNDIATDWVTLEVIPAPPSAAMLRDPDGHIVVLTGAKG